MMNQSRAEMSCSLKASYLMNAGQRPAPGTFTAVECCCCYYYYCCGEGSVFICRFSRASVRNPQDLVLLLLHDGHDLRARAGQTAGLHHTCIRTHTITHQPAGDTHCKCMRERLRPVKYLL